MAEEAREGGVEARASVKTGEEGDEAQEQEQPGGGEREEAASLAIGAESPALADDSNGGGGGEGASSGAAAGGAGALPEEDAAEAVCNLNPGREPSYGTVSSTMFMSGAAADGARWVNANTAGVGLDVCFSRTQYSVLSVLWLSAVKSR